MRECYTVRQYKWKVASQMNRIDRSEARCARVNRIFFPLYLLLCAGMAAAYALKRDGYHLGVSLGALAIPIAMALFYRLTGLKLVHQIDFIILAFTLIAYPLGSCLDFYARFPGYDKLMHLLSGAFVSLLCILLYCVLKPGHRIGREDFLLSLAFTFFGSMAVAGLWELAEYGITLVTGRDVQHVLDSGVADTMQDMLACMLGTLAALALLRPLSQGRQTRLTAPIDAFLERNLPIDA